jgi:hypothetical protein
MKETFVEKNITHITTKYFTIVGFKAFSRILEFINVRVFRPSGKTFGNTFT